MKRNCDKNQFGKHGLKQVDAIFKNRTREIEHEFWQNPFLIFIDSGFNQINNYNY